MCCTFAPARLSKTLLYAGEATWGGRYVHVLAYQNTASTSGPNAMILPLPAARIGPENAVDTRPFRTFLEDLREATRAPPRPSFGLPEESLKVEAQVFDVGSYTVVLSSSAEAAFDALAGVPEGKRPAINARVLDAFARYYPGWPVAVCCWQGDLAPEPLLWWYEPRFPAWLFAPALDAHDGGPPDLSARVWVDHYVSFGSALRPHGLPVQYRDDAGSFRPLLPDLVRGTYLFTSMANGDFWAETQEPSHPALRSTPGTRTGEPVPLDGWEGPRPPWTTRPEPPPRMPAGMRPREGFPGEKRCPQCGMWSFPTGSTVCPVCGAFW
jgi:hypothetical protein